jgi:hypothetical protein
VLLEAHNLVVRVAVAFVATQSSTLPKHDQMYPPQKQACVH